MANIAVIQLGGAQHVVKAGDKLQVNRLEHEVDSAFTPQVLMSTKGTDVLFGKGDINAKILENGKGEKIYTVKFRAKSRYRRRTGHRQLLSTVHILSVNGEEVEKKTGTKAKTESTEVVETQSVEAATPVKKAKTTRKPSTAKKEVKS